jgi:metal-responsive CopG/Arc/MetJ family transcriptional regulator
MRKKIPDEEKKKSITLTLNPYINELLDKHLKEIGLNKSEFIENLLRDKLKNNNS